MMALALLRSVLRALSLTAPCRPRRPDGRKAGRSGEEYGKTEPFCHLERGIFLKDFWNRHQGTIAALLLFAAAALVVIYVIAVFGGAIMRLFGFRYNSVGSIFLFFVLATIVSFPISQFAEALPRVLLFHYGNLSRRAAIALFVGLDTIATAVGLYVVDCFLDSVSATGCAVVVVSFLLALVSAKGVLEEPD